MSQPTFARLRGWGVALSLAGTLGLAHAQVASNTPPDDPAPPAAQAAPAVGGVKSANIFEIAPDASTDPN